MMTLGLLPAHKPPYKRFAIVMAAQAVAVLLLIVFGALFPDSIAASLRKYNVISLVSIPAPIPVEPAPIKVFPTPRIVARVIPAPEIRQKPSPEIAPKIEVAISKPAPILPSTAPVIPRQLVRTNTFSTGSSAVPTIAAAPKNVQTGGFGDPNGVPAHETNGRPANIAALGNFDLPTGPGSGNGTGGANGKRGVIASTGFGNGVATGDGSGRVNASRGTVQQTGFNDRAAAPVAHAKVDDQPKVIPAQIISKPVPQYTAEARQLQIEGSVTLEVIFGADGHLRIVNVVHGLGHGLDENAVKAAELIQFKPAQRDGQPADYSAQIRIVFQLAS